MPPRLPTRLGVLATAALLVLAACGGDDGTDAADTSADTTGGGTGATTVAPEPSGTVTVYTGRHYGIEPVFEEFTAATGIEVRFTTGNDPELRERLKAEGENTPADLYMAADAGNLSLAAADDLLAPLPDPELEAAIPENLRDPEGRWYALSRRARVVMVASERVTAAEAPTTYAGLGDPTWKGRLCLRPATHPYTQSLVASIIAAEGEAGAEAIVGSWVANEPTYINSDTDILKALAAGECDVALTNTYYLPRLQADDPDFPVTPVWPEQDGRGAHVNISGAGVVANAPNPEAAALLLEWLATEGQESFAAVNNEFPADPTATPAPTLEQFGDFVADPIPVTRFGELQPAAVQLLDRMGYQ